MPDLFGLGEDRRDCPSPNAVAHWPPVTQGLTWCASKPVSRCSLPRDACLKTGGGQGGVGAGVSELIPTTAQKNVSSLKKWKKKVLAKGKKAPTSPLSLLEFVEWWVSNQLKVWDYTLGKRRDPQGSSISIMHEELNANGQ